MGTLAVQSSGGKSPFGDISAADRESILQSGFLIYLAGIIEPRSKASAAAKPQSGFNNLPALRRVQHRMMMDFVIYKAASLTLKAQVKAFIRDNGPDALVSARKEPLDANGLRQILALEPGRLIGTRKLDWSTLFFVSFKALLCTGLAAAFRKAEICLPDGAESSLGRLSVESVSWVIGGNAVQRATFAQLRALRVGDQCIIRPPLCKNDPFGLHFSTKPIWLPVNKDSVNAASATAALFMRHGRYPDDAKHTPLSVSTLLGHMFGTQKLTELFEISS